MGHFRKCQAICVAESIKTFCCINPPPSSVGGAEIAVPVCMHSRKQNLHLSCSPVCTRFLYQWKKLVKNRCKLLKQCKSLNKVNNNNKIIISKCDLYNQTKLRNLLSTSLCLIVDFLIADALSTWLFVYFLWGGFVHKIIILVQYVYSIS